MITHKMAPGYPKLCDNESVFIMFLTGQLIAIVLSVVAVGFRFEFWLDLVERSFFIHWVGLGSAAVICLCRTWLQRCALHMAWLFAFLISQIVTLTCSFIFWLVIPLSLLSWHDIARAQLISCIVCAIAARYFYLNAQWAMTIENESEARFSALQSRIRPHFLFNILNVLATLQRTQPEQAEAGLLDLADLLRHNVMSKGWISIRDEVLTIERYVNLERLRFGEGLVLSLLFDSAINNDTHIPALLLQPLIENAIQHGVRHFDDGGIISLTLLRHDHDLKVEITNLLPPNKVVPGLGVGQQNVRERLQHLYGKAGTFDILITPKSDEQFSYEVHLLLPNVFQNT